MSAITAGSRMMAARVDMMIAPAAGSVGSGAALPDYASFALARLRLLHDVPFRYLVPDARLLPGEAMRFFTLDDLWLDRLVEGALNAASNGSRERARARAAAQQALGGSVSLRYGVRKVGLGRITFDQAMAEDRDFPQGTVSGMLLRSRLVTDWPSLSVRAWFSSDPAEVPPGADPDQLQQARPDLAVPILRFEQLSPGIMLVLFDGIPRTVWLEEPHGSVQFGVERGQAAGSIDIRDEQGRDTPASVAVPLRPGPVGGVVDVAALAAAIDGARPLSQPRGSAGIALQLLRPPVRQRFTS